MSNRSLLEFNHDYCPRNSAGANVLGAQMRNYMAGADVAYLPPGVVRKHYRHHSDPDPMVMLDQLAGDLRAAQAREGELVAALREAREWIADDIDGTIEANCVCDADGAPIRSTMDADAADEIAGFEAFLTRIDSALTRTTTPDLAAAFRAETESAQGGVP